MEESVVVHVTHTYLQRPSATPAAEARPLASTTESTAAISTYYNYIFFFFSSRRRHTRFDCDWSSDVCSSDLSLSFEGGVWTPEQALVNAGTNVVQSFGQDGAGELYILTGDGRVLQIMRQ